MSINITIARPYAKAAFAKAMEDKTLSEWSTLLRVAAQAVCDKQIFALLNNPNYSSEQRLNYLFDICQAFLQEPTKNFLKLLAENGRLTLLPEISNEFENYRIEQEKITTVQVTSAFDLDDLYQEKLKTRLTKQLGRDVILECKTDKQLIGGFIIRAKDLVIDGSVRGKLSRLANILIN